MSYLTHTQVLQSLCPAAELQHGAALEVWQLLVWSCSLNELVKSSLLMYDSL